jgi:hypothetical protein
MSNKVYLSFLLVFSFLLVSTNSFAQKSEWKYIKNIDGIKIYHKKNGNLKDVKVETTFSAPMSNVVEALLDVSSFSKWIYKVKYSKIIKIVSPFQTIYYNQIDMPWPSKDRDLVALNTVKQDPKTKVVVSEDIVNSSDFPKYDDFIRIKDFYAKWTFTPTDKGVAGEYIFHSDPGGDLPDALINLLIDEGPVNSIKAFKKLINDKKYQYTNSRKILN